MYVFSKSMLLEGARDNALAVYIPLFQERGANVTVSQLKQFLLRKFVDEANIRNLSLRSNYYLAGVARYYFNGDLTKNKKLNALNPNTTDVFNEDVCVRLNALIKILRQAYIDSVGTQFEQPEDFGTMTIKKLFRKYGKKIDQELGVAAKEENEGKEEKVLDTRAGKKYTYDILYSYEDATKYNKFTEPGAWCITYGKQHYNGYIKRLNIHYVIFLVKGYEKVPRKVGKGFTKQKPHDEYGNSMIAVLQSNVSPEPIYITSRWNHGAYQDHTQGTEADHAYTKQEFLDVIGCDESILTKCFEQWKACRPKRGSNIDRKQMNVEKLEALRNFKYAQMLLNGGSRISDIPDTLVKFYVSPGFVKSNDFYEVQTEVNGTYYTTVMDRKNILFDDIFTSSDLRFYHFDSLETKYNQIYDDTKGFLYMFDCKRHRFLNVDGVKKFKHFTTSAYWDSGYMIIGVTGTQIALIDLNNGRPIKARNGDVWFEGITEINSWFDHNNEYRTVRFPCLKKDTLLRLTYDSSAQIIYLFSLAKKDFINLPKDEEENFKPNLRNQSLGVMNSRFIKYISETAGPDNNRTLCKLYDFIDEKWYVIPGTNEQHFSQLFIYTFSGFNKNFLIMGFELPDGNKQVCIYEKGENLYDKLYDIVDFGNINTRAMNIYSIRDHNKFLAFELTGKGSYSITDPGNRVMLYNVYTKSFYNDKEFGRVFEITRPRFGWAIYFANSADEDGNLRKIPNAEKITSVTEGVRNKFNIILEKLNRR